MSACDHCVEAEADVLLCEDCEEDAHQMTRETGFEAGAAVAFGLMGMAEAIRSVRVLCRTCGSWTKETEQRHKLPCEECGAPTECDRAFCNACEFPERAPLVIRSTDTKEGT